MNTFVCVIVGVSCVSVPLCVCICNRVDAWAGGEGKSVSKGRSTPTATR